LRSWNNGFEAYAFGGCGRMIWRPLSLESLKNDLEAFEFGAMEE